ncbi:MAG: MotA/TolQ/ExbB proton channel family protein [Burkholderiaceae bacterium]|nr:MotA/TolQ/ExbB proton channel family protein [Burkholderiaceae bacterium]
MESQFGLLNVWAQGDWVTRAVTLLLLGMSLASWMVIIVKALTIVSSKRLARNTETFWQAPDFAEGLTRLGPVADNPFRELAEEGREAAAHLRQKEAQRNQLQDSLDLSDWVTRCLRNSIDHTTARLQNGLAILASVGSTAPFVGLFGTVWGIYHALMGIGAAGEATIDKVAGPIGEALIMTAMGLAVAIPAVLGYNALVRGNKFVINKLNRFAYDLHAYFVTGARVNGGSDGKVVPMKKA